MAENKGPGAEILNTLAENQARTASSIVDADKGSLDKPNPPSPTPPPFPSPIPQPFNQSSHDRARLAPFIAGFVRAIESLQGAVPAVWNDRSGAAEILANSIPRLTTARLIVFCRDSKQDLAVVAARVLTDMFATEPGLLELTPEEAAQEGSALMQQMWPQGAFQPKVVVDEVPEVKHPVLDKLMKLASQWHRLALMPTEQAKMQNPTLWRAQVLNDIAVTKAEGLREGLTKGMMMKALLSAGDQWTWEVPPPAMGFVSDEFGQPPQGSDIVLANMPN